MNVDANDVRLKSLETAPNNFFGDKLKNFRFFFFFLGDFFLRILFQKKNSDKNSEQKTWKSLQLFFEQICPGHF